MKRKLLFYYFSVFFELTILVLILVIAGYYSLSKSNTLTLILDDQASYIHFEKQHELQDYNKPGYAFLGYYLDASFTSPYDNSVVKNDTVLYVKYELINYQITYDLRGGTSHEFFVTSFTVKSQRIILPFDVTKPDTSFIAWCKNYNSVTNRGEIIFAIETGTVGDLTLTAIFETNNVVQYTVRHLVEDFFTGNYMVYSSKILDGVVGTSLNTSALNLSSLGYVCSFIPSGSISSMAVFDFLYNLKTYEVAFEYDTGLFYKMIVKHGTTLSLSTLDSNLLALMLPMFSHFEGDLANITSDRAIKIVYQDGLGTIFYRDYHITATYIDYDYSETYETFDLMMKTVDPLHLDLVLLPIVDGYLLPQITYFDPVFRNMNISYDRVSVLVTLLSPFGIVDSYSVRVGTPTTVFFSSIVLPAAPVGYLYLYSTPFMVIRDNTILQINLVATSVSYTVNIYVDDVFDSSLTLWDFAGTLVYPPITLFEYESLVGFNLYQVLGDGSLVIELRYYLGGL